MLGLSYGEIFLILGATAALIGPKDLPLIARTAGRLAGRSIGYVQMARGQFDSVMQQTQAKQLHKEVQDVMAQLQVIRHQVRSVSSITPGNMATRLVDNLPNQTLAPIVDEELPKPPQESVVKAHNVLMAKDQSLPTSMASDMHSQATTYARLAESTSLRTGSVDEDLSELTDESGRFIVFPISAETAKLLPTRKGELLGSDVLLEAIVEADVAHNAKGYFMSAQYQKERK